MHEFRPIVVTLSDLYHWKVLISAIFCCTSISLYLLQGKCYSPIITGIGVIAQCNSILGYNTLPAGDTHFCLKK